MSVASTSLRADLQEMQPLNRSSSGAGRLAGRLVFKLPDEGLLSKLKPFAKSMTRIEKLSKLKEKASETVQATYACEMAKQYLLENNPRSAFDELMACDSNSPGYLLLKAETYELLEKLVPAKRLYGKALMRKEIEGELRKEVQARLQKVDDQLMDSFLKRKDTLLFDELEVLFEIECAFDRLQKEAQSGSLSAKSLIASFYFAGIGVERDVARALQLWEECAAENHASSIQRLGEYYGAGKFLKSDVVKEISYYRKAVKLGSGSAMQAYGFCLEVGKGGESNEIRAVKYYNKSIAAGFKGALFNLAFCYRNGVGVGKDERRALNLFLEGAEAGVLTALEELAFMYKKGNGVAVDLKKSNFYFRQAADYGSPVALHELAIVSFQHMQDARGVALLQEAAKMGNGASAEYLGKIYSDGYLVLRDMVKAVHYYEMAVNLGHVHSMYELGRLYYQGFLVEKDFERAAMWFRKGMESGDLKSTEMLAMFYHKGYGVPPDLKIARELYHRALDIQLDQAFES